MQFIQHIDTTSLYNTFIQHVYTARWNNMQIKKFK